MSKENHFYIWILSFFKNCILLFFSSLVKILTYSVIMFHWDNVECSYFFVVVSPYFMGTCIFFFWFLEHKLVWMDTIFFFSVGTPFYFLMFIWWFWHIHFLFLNIHLISVYTPDIKHLAFCNFFFTSLAKEYIPLKRGNRKLILC